MLITAGLLGAAVGVLLLSPRQGARLRRVLPARETTPQERDPARTRRLTSAGAGVLALLLLGPSVGLPVGALVALGGPRALALLDDKAQRADDDLAQQLPLLLDLLAACLAGGAGMLPALTAVADATAGTPGERLRRVASALEVGLPPELAFRELGSEGAAGAAARALCRASEGGTPVAAAVAAVAEDARRRAQLVSRRRARRAVATSAAPLVACFLPAFLALGIVPCFVGMAGPLLSSF